MFQKKDRERNSYYKREINHTANNQNENIIDKKGKQKNKRTNW